MKNAAATDLHRTLVLDYLMDEILCFVNNGTQRIFTLDYVDHDTILGGDKITEERLMRSFYLVESASGRRLSGKQKKLLLRGIDLNELTQQRERFVYLLKHHPSMVDGRKDQKVSVDLDRQITFREKLRSLVIHWSLVVLVCASVMAASVGVYFVCRSLFSLFR